MKAGALALFAGCVLGLAWLLRVPAPEATLFCDDAHPSERPCIRRSSAWTIPTGGYANLGPSRREALGFKLTAGGPMILLTSDGGWDLRLNGASMRPTGDGGTIEVRW